MKIIFFVIVLFLPVKTFSLEINRGGVVEGVVIDRLTMQPLQGANIIIQGTSLGASTNEQGQYCIKDIPPGVYLVKVTMIGYEKIIKTDVRILVNRVTTVNCELKSMTVELSKGAEIFGGYFAKDPEKTVSTMKLSPEEIKSSPGSAEDVFRIIHNFPGVTTANMANSNLIVRGGAPDENLVYLDNVEIFSPLHFGKIEGSAGNISIINPSLLESAEFSSGGFPSAYGGKLSSLFELKMKEGNKTRMNSDFNMNMAGFGYSADGPITDKSTLVISARRGIFDIITKMMGKAMMPRYWDAAGKITSELSSRNKISIIGFYYKDDLEKNEKQPDSHSAEARKFDYLKLDVYGSALGMNWKYMFSDNGYSISTAAVTTNGFITNGGDNSSRLLKKEDIKEQEFSLKNETILKINNVFEIKGGAFVKSVSPVYNSWLATETSMTGHVFQTETVNYKPNISFKGGGFLQTTARCFPKFVFTVGVRDDYFDLTKENIVNPRFSVSYELHPKITLNAAYAKLSQDPAAYQMYIAPENRALKSSRADQYIIGINNLISDDVQLTIEAYFKGLKKTFTVSDTSKLITNNGSGSIAGFEFFLQKKMSDALVGSLSYSYSVSKRRDSRSTPEYSFNYDRTHNINLVCSYKISEVWQAGFKLAYSSGTPYTPVTGITMLNNSYVAVAGERNSSRLPAYQQLDIRFDRKFYFSNWTLNVYIDIWNAYNHKNVVDYSQRVDASGKISKYPIYDFGILPILGMSAQF
ncbi:MAG: TonB-dependent receptor [Ignavibacteriales bacterium]|nr:TonB-dependent receptor [Ignavibacteriales bacterium]